MISQNMAKIPVSPHLLASAEDSKIYKPDLQMFRFAYDKAGIGFHRAVHVAAGFHHDIEPASRLGIRRIWINRRGEVGDPTYAPYDELANLDGLLDLLPI